MVTAGRSPRMMAQKGQVADTSREPSAAPSLAQGGVRARGGDLEPLLGDADVLDRHPGRELRDADGEVHQVAEDVGWHPGEVGDLDDDLVVADLGDLGGSVAAETQDVD